MVSYRPRFAHAGLLFGLPGLVTVVVLAALYGLVGPAPAAQADASIGNCSNQTDLRAALITGGYISFSCGTATITITPTLIISQNTTIDGGNTITLDGNQLARIIDVQSGKALTLANITLKNGTSFGAPGGGAVRLNGSASLLAVNTVLTNNRALTDVTLSAVRGGAVFADSGTVVISGSQVVSNAAANDGGGVHGSGQVSVFSSTFAGNWAGFWGGAIRGVNVDVTGGSVLSNTSGDRGGGIHADTNASLTNSQIISNTTGAFGGGGVHAGGTVSAHTTLIDGNTGGGAGNGGGGIRAAAAFVSGGHVYRNASSGVGGGLYVGSAQISGSTIATNTSAMSGGGVYALSPIVVSETEFLSNTAVLAGGGFYAEASSVVSASTFTNNRARDGAGFAVSGTVTATNSSFVGNATTGGVVAEGGGFRARQRAFVSGSSFVDNYAGYGGGFYSFQETTVADSMLVSNTAVNAGGGLFVFGNAQVVGSTFVTNSGGAGGGGFYALEASVSGSRFISNAGGGGGGFWVIGNVVVSNTRFLSNTTTVFGGGGGFYSSNAAVFGSSFTGNFAGNGGGFYALGFQGSTVSESSFLSNTTSGSGGGFSGRDVVISRSAFLGNRAGTTGTGGAIDINLARIHNSTFANNTAQHGGAIRSSDGIELVNTTVVNNSAPSVSGSGPVSKPLTATESIIAGVSLPLCQNLNLVTVNSNIIGDSAGCGPFSGPAPIQADPLLGAAQDNGGPTWTMAPATNSPARGENHVGGACVTTLDQRGLFRTSPCDIGAYETGIAPSISSLSPFTATVLDPAFTLTVNGTGFISGIVTLWDGSPRPTTVLNATTLSVSIPASDLLAVGTVQVQARYGLAPDGTSSALPFTISKRTQTIAFSPLGDKTVNDPPVTLTATASSGLTVSFAAGPAGVCSVLGSTLSLLSVGACTVTASQAGDAVYAAADPVERAFTIARGQVFLGFTIKGYAGGW